MQQNSFDPLHKDVKHHAASGFIYSGLSQATRIVTQFLSVVIMARLLDPADFGLIAEVSPIYAFALMFHDLGLGQATIQRPNLTSAQVNSFFWINSAVGIALTAILILCSPLVGWFYHDQRTIPLTIAMALLIAFSGLGNQHGALLQRRMAFRNQAILNIAASVATLVVAIVWGILFHNYWALYAGMAAGTILASLGAWFTVDWRPARPALAAETKEMLKYGLHITSGNFLNFVVGNINNIVIGRFLGDKLLGLYDRASRLVYSPLQQLTFPIGGVVVPILYRLQDDADKYRRIFLRTIGTITLSILPAIVWVVVASDIAVNTLLGPKWQEATPVFSVLTFCALPQLVNSAANWLIMTQGRSKDFARWSLISGVFSLIGLFAGLPYGILGVAVASAIIQVIRTPIYWWVACRTGPVRAWQVFITLLPHLTGGVVAVPLLIVLRHVWGNVYPLPLLIAGTCISYLIVVITVMLFPAGKIAIKRDVDFVKFMILRALGRNSTESPVS